MPSWLDIMSRISSVAKAASPIARAVSPYLKAVNIITLDALTIGEDVISDISPSTRKSVTLALFILGQISDLLDNHDKREQITENKNFANKLNILKLNQEISIAPERGVRFTNNLGLHHSIGETTFSALLGGVNLVCGIASFYYSLQAPDSNEIKTDSRSSAAYIFGAVGLAFSIFEQLIKSYNLDRYDAQLNEEIRNLSVLSNYTLPQELETQPVATQANDNENKENETDNAEETSPLQHGPRP